MKKQLLQYIDDRIDQLNELDVEGHIWWNRFRGLIEDFEIEKEKHPTTIAEYSKDLNHLAEDIGNLRYDALANFLDALAQKLRKDFRADADRNRPILATTLYLAYGHMAKAKKEIDSAWKVSKPFMNLEN